LQEGTGNISRKSCEWGAAQQANIKGWNRVTSTKGVSLARQCGEGGGRGRRELAASPGTPLVDKHMANTARFRRVQVGM
jgi:hypothetical protein